MQSPSVVDELKSCLANSTENPMVRHEAAEALGMFEEQFFKWKIIQTRKILIEFYYHIYILNENKVWCPVPLHPLKITTLFCQTVQHLYLSYVKTTSQNLKYGAL